MADTMAQTLTSGRKRTRNNCEEECCDFMPLSKRINNLNINGNCCKGLGHPHGILDRVQCFSHWDGQREHLIHESESLHNLITSRAEDCQVNLVQSHYQENCGGNSNNSSLESSVSSQINMLHSYSPELGVADNPHYYDSNKLLYTLYVERMQRSGVPLY